MNFRPILTCAFVLCSTAPSFAQGADDLRATERQTVASVYAGYRVMPTDPYVSYRLMPGDVVDIRFFYNPELNEQNVAVRPDGRIALQMVGDVDVAAKTPQEAGQMIERLFATRLRTPSVTIQIRKYASNKVYVTGEVPKPGVVDLEGPTSLVAAIGEAGGITVKGNRDKVILIRKMPNGTAARRSVRLFQHGEVTEEAAAYLQPFDVVFVPESSISRADRWVDQWMKQLSPANLDAGFQYLKQPVQTFPIF